MTMFTTKLSRSVGTITFGLALSLSSAAYAQDEAGTPDVAPPEIESFAADVDPPSLRHAGGSTRCL